MLRVLLGTHDELHPTGHLRAVRLARQSIHRLLIVVTLTTALPLAPPGTEYQTTGRLQSG